MHIHKHSVPLQFQLTLVFSSSSGSTFISGRIFHSVSTATLRIHTEYNSATCYTVPTWQCVLWPSISYCCTCGTVSIQETTDSTGNACINLSLYFMSISRDSLQNWRSGLLGGSAKYMACTCKESVYMCTLNTRILYNSVTIHFQAFYLNPIIMYVDSHTAELILRSPCSQK